MVPLEKVMIRSLFRPSISLNSSTKFAFRSLNIARVKQPAPDFNAQAVVNKEFKTISLADYKGKNWLVLFFYPLDFTFVCPTEIIEFSERAAEFEKLG